ncbi:MAG: hypothetical protein JXK05_11805 [Campylobacterales bacterium]|nr:hypothetical protein [Campylobacterales bacterium]
MNRIRLLMGALLSVLPLLASCTPFQDALQTRAAAYDVTCKESQSGESVTCKPSGNLGASMTIPVLRTPTLPTLGNETTTSFDTALKALHVSTMSVGMKNRFEAAATDAIHIGTLTMGVESSLSLKAPTLSIATLNESASSSPNTITLIADTLEIGALNLADNTRLSIAPFSAASVTVVIGTMRSGSKAHIALASGEYHIGTWTTSGGGLQTSITPTGKVILVHGSNLTVGAANLLNADASGDICSDTHNADDLTLLVHGDVTLKANNRASAILYATGDVTLESGVAFKGAISAQSAINLHQGVKVCYAGCAGSVPTQPQATLTSLGIELDRNELAEGNATTLHVRAFYDDNSIKILSGDFNLSIGDSSIVSFDGNTTLMALKEGETALLARYHGITSNALILSVYKAVNGHRLPPQPDEAQNNSTLLGIDSNNNGVRDDVERWIFSEYDHPVVQAAAMQNAKVFQIILVDPSKARQTKKVMENAHDCIVYYQLYADNLNEELLIPENIEIYEESLPIILNTKERSRAYYKYNQVLSGGIYPLRNIETLKSKCDFNATKVMRGEW